MEHVSWVPFPTHLEVILLPPTNNLPPSSLLSIPHSPRSEQITASVPTHTLVSLPFLSLPLRRRPHIEQIKALSLITAIKTPYLPDGRFDLDAYDELVHHQIENGAEGLIVGGTTGEGHLMSWDEHVMLIAHSVYCFGNKLKIVGNTGSNSTREAMHATEQGFAVGMHAALQINPYYGKTSLDGLKSHFDVVLPMGPAIVYNVPGRTGQDIPPSVIEAIATHENFAGVKECAGNERIHGYAEKGIVAWSGNDDQFHDAKWNHGGQGVISVVSNLVPGIVSQLLKGPNPELNAKIAPLVNWLFVEPNPIGLNTALCQLGLVRPVFRLPYVPLNKESRQKFVDIVHAIGLEHFPGAKDVRVSIGADSFLASTERVGVRAVVHHVGDLGKTARALLARRVEASQRRASETHNHQRCEQGSFETSHVAIRASLFMEQGVCVVSLSTRPPTHLLYTCLWSWAYSCSGLTLNLASGLPLPAVRRFFVEQGVFAQFIRIMALANQPSPLCEGVMVQLLQTLNLMIQNLKSEKAIYYMFSKEHINNVISFPFDFSDEELLAYYISFLKTLSMKLDKSTISYFIVEKEDGSSAFPLYVEAIRFFHHEESMVRIAVRTLTLTIYNVHDERANRFVLSPSAIRYFEDLAIFVRQQSFTLARLVANAVRNFGSIVDVGRVEASIAEIGDLLYYCNDVMSAGIPQLSEVVSEHLLSIWVFPVLLASLSPESGSPNAKRISPLCAMYLLSRVLHVVTYRPFLDTATRSIAASLSASPAGSDGVLPQLPPVPPPVASAAEGRDGGGSAAAADRAEGKKAKWPLSARREDADSPGGSFSEVQDGRDSRDGGGEEAGEKGGERVGEAREIAAAADAPNGYVAGREEGEGKHGEDKGTGDDGNRSGGRSGVVRSASARDRPALSARRHLRTQSSGSSRSLTDSPLRNKISDSPQPNESSDSPQRSFSSPHRSSPYRKQRHASDTIILDLDPTASAWDTIVSYLLCNNERWVLASLCVLCGLLQNTAVHDSLLEELGMLPCNRRHRRLLVEALVGNQSEEQLKRLLRRQDSDAVEGGKQAEAGRGGGGAGESAEAGREADRLSHGAAEAPLGSGGDAAVAPAPAAGSDAGSVSGSSVAARAELRGDSSRGISIQVFNVWVRWGRHPVIKTAQQKETTGWWHDDMFTRPMDGGRMPCLHDDVSTLSPPPTPHDSHLQLVDMVFVLLCKRPRLFCPIYFTPLRSPPSPPGGGDGVCAVVQETVVDTVFVLLCKRPPPSPEALWHAGWLLRQLLPSSHRLQSAHKKLLTHAYELARGDLVGELLECWCDMLPAAMVEEWKACRKALESATLANDSSLVLMPSLPPLLTDGDSSSAAFGERMRTVVKVYVALHQMRATLLGLPLPDVPPLATAAPPPLDARFGRKGLNLPQAQEGTEVPLEPGDAIPCRVAFERGKEKYVLLLVASCAANGWVLLAEPPAGMTAKAAVAEGATGIVRVVAPLAGCQPSLDPKHKRWLHLRIRSPQAPASDAGTLASRSPMGSRARTKRLADGRWTLAFSDEAACKFAHLAVREESYVQGNAVRSMLLPLLGNVEPFQLQREEPN
ncbi:unnamed protein product [Closterium sp. Yama58-4]|nr:unnamed protein product [Closterium sp. Yama58-4]